MKEKAGLGALVDTREMRDFLAWGHAHIRITLSKAPRFDNIDHWAVDGVEDAAHTR
jgi:hypothetical protein